MSLVSAFYSGITYSEDEEFSNGHHDLFAGHVDFSCGGYRLRNIFRYFDSIFHQFLK